LSRPVLTAALAGALALLQPGCYHGGFSSEQVSFEAPSPPAPELRPYLEQARRIGVLARTNIAPFKELDVEKVLGRLADATARGLGRLSGKTVVTQDEIFWHCAGLQADTTSGLSADSRRRLQKELELDLLVYLDLKGLQAQMTPMSPSPYGGLVARPGLDLSVDLRVSLIDLKNGQTWSQKGAEQRTWQSIQLQVFGDPQAERQLLSALASPLQQFLARAAPPPSQQVRYFELSGD
jgi:hypothetical protein